MNYISGLACLRNQYFQMRHGYAQSNLERLLIGSPENAINGYGLTWKGKRQARASARKHAGILGPGLLVYSSDYARARETAEIVRKVLKARPVFLTPLLRERNFGELERKASYFIRDMWMLDEQNPSQKKHGVESANELQERVTKLVYELEQEHDGEKILIVSHGDPLQVLQVSALNMSPGLHNRISYIKNAEVRPLELCREKVEECFERLRKKDK